MYTLSKRQTRCVKEYQSQIHYVYLSCYYGQNESEICKILILTSSDPARRFLSLLLEVLVGTELTKECEEHMKRFYRSIILCRLVNRNVTHCAYQLGVVGNVHVDFSTRERDLLEGCLHLRVPFLHQCLDVWHIL